MCMYLYLGVFICWKVNTNEQCDNVSVNHLLLFNQIGLCRMFWHIRLSYNIFAFSIILSFVSCDLWDIVILILRRFGTWTVARLLGDKSSIVLQGPICNGSRVIGWHTNESNGKSKRFHAEMPGFAFNSTILWDPKRWHRPTLEPIRQLDSVKESLWVSKLIYLFLMILSVM